MLYLADVFDIRVLVNMVDSSVVNMLLTTSRNVLVSCGHKKTDIKMKKPGKKTRKPRKKRESPGKKSPEIRS